MAILNDAALMAIPEQELARWDDDPIAAVERLRDRVCDALDAACAIHHEARLHPQLGLRAVAEDAHPALHRAIVAAQAIWFDTPARRYLERSEPVYLNSQGRPDPTGPTGSCYHDLALRVAVGLWQWIGTNEPAEMLHNYLRYYTAAGDQVEQYLCTIQAHVACECRQAVERYRNEIPATKRGDQPAFTPVATAPVGDVPFVPSDLQERTLEALLHKALTLDALAVKLHVDRSTLHRDALKELRARQKIANHRRIGGYYRPDAPPPKYAKILGKLDASAAGEQGGNASARTKR